MKTTTKWRRIRPGLYRLHSNGGARIAEIERGAETGHWYWWTPWGDIGRAPSLGDAKDDVVLPSCHDEVKR